jgi:acetoin utilization deacetylase AcuC-like enzyme
MLTISLHQERNYPLDTGGVEATGGPKAPGSNVNLPLPPGTGHQGYLYAMERIVLPALERFQPEAIIVACGFDAAAVDPLGRMLCTAETFRHLTRIIMQAADRLCDGRLTLVHEGGYSEVYVPFCGHAVLEELSAASVTAPDPLATTLAKRQPDARFDAFVKGWIDEAATTLGL